MAQLTAGSRHEAKNLRIGTLFRRDGDPSEWVFLVMAKGEEWVTAKAVAWYDDPCKPPPATITVPVTTTVVVCKRPKKIRK